jgi:hypothetical protein
LIRADHEWTNFVTSGALSLAAQDHELINFDDFSAIDSFVASSGQSLDIKSYNLDIFIQGNASYWIDFYLVVVDQGGVITSPTEIADSGANDVRACLDAMIDSRYTFEKIGRRYVPKTIYFTDVLQKCAIVKLDVTKAARLYVKHAHNEVKTDDKPSILIIGIITGATGLAYTYDKSIQCFYDEHTLRPRIALD